jgi:outer membrane lipoprotein-sorting protein
MKLVNKGLRDYSSSVKITGLARYSIIDMNIYAEAVYYFKDPDKHRLKISKGPHYLAQYPQVMGWSLPSPHEWTCKIRETRENGKDYIVLKLIPIHGMGDLLKTEMWVDKSSYLFLRQVYFYRDNGKLTLDSSYQVVNGFYLFNKLVGHLEFPKKKIKADAEANYGEYKINQGIDDSVFQEEKKK